MDETHELGSVNGVACSNGKGKNNPHGRDSSQGKQLEFSRNGGALSSKNSRFVKLFRCKFLKSRAFTLIEIMVVVSVLGVLGMGLRNTVKKVLHDYEVYSAVNFCKKIDSALKNCYLINNTDREIGFFDFLAYLTLLNYGLFVTQNDLKPFLPNDLIRKEIDCSILDSMVEKASEAGEEVDYDNIAEIKDATNDLCFNFNTPKCIKIALVLEMTILFVLKETLVDDFLKYYPNATVSDVSEDEVNDYLELGLDLRGYKSLSITVDRL